MKSRKWHAHLTFITTAAKYYTPTYKYYIVCVVLSSTVSWTSQKPYPLKPLLQTLLILTSNRLMFNLYFILVRARSVRTVFRIEDLDALLCEIIIIIISNNHRITTVARCARVPPSTALISWSPVIVLELKKKKTEIHCVKNNSSSWNVSKC